MKPNSTKGQSFVAAMSNQGCGSCRTVDVQGVNCYLDVSTLSVPYLVVEMDCASRCGYSSTGPKCDHILFVDKKDGELPRVAPIELKSTGLRPDKIIRQLAAGAKVAARAASGRTVKFVPVAVYEVRPKKHVDNKLRDARVAFGKISASIRTLQCGDAIEKVLYQQ